MVNVVTCPDCGGTGKIIKNKCSRCHGSGTTRKQKKLEVNIPAGADTGVRMRISGEGEPGKRGGPRGIFMYIFTSDLILILNGKGMIFTAGYLFLSRQRRWEALSR